eukprot:5837928-Ditylum_brightwellii.AAC.1
MRNNQARSKHVTAAHEKHARQECFCCGKGVYNLKTHTLTCLGIKGAKERLQNVPVLYDEDMGGIMNVAPGYATSGKAKML